jgi:hypothetical protein
MTMAKTASYKGSAVLGRELDFYHEKLPEWGEHEGKYALIHDQQLVDFYSSYEDAIKVGYAQFGLEPFLVKQVHALEQVQFVSRFIEPVPS